MTSALGGKGPCWLTTSAPPSPQMKFFVSWKLSAEKRPKLPSGRSR